MSLPTSQRHSAFRQNGEPRMCAPRDRNSIEITDFLPGSIVVKFKLKGDRMDIAQRTSDMLASQLLSQVSDGASPLMQGLVTSSAKKADITSLPPQSAMSTPRSVVNPKFARLADAGESASHPLSLSELGTSSQGSVPVPSAFQEPPRRAEDIASLRTMLNSAEMSATLQALEKSPPPSPPDSLGATPIQSPLVSQRTQSPLASDSPQGIRAEGDDAAAVARIPAVRQPVVEQRQQLEATAPVESGDGEYREEDSPRVSPQFSRTATKLRSVDERERSSIELSRSRRTAIARRYVSCTPCPL